MGACTVLEFGMRYPDVAQALVCCGGGPALSEIEIREIVHEEQEILGDPQIAEVMEARHSHVYGEGYWRTLVTHLHQLLTAGYSEKEYSRVVAPTLVMCGDHEERPGVEAYVALFRELAHGELAVIPNADHFSPTNNVKVFTSIISEFFWRSNVF
jgi:pimeloyl-ACP methyl ester carboxylesterase